MKRHAIINNDNEVINVIVWDGYTRCNFPAEWTVKQFDECDIGDIHDPLENKIIKADRTAQENIITLG